MLPYVLVAAGALVVAATLVAARRTRPGDEPVPDDQDRWSAFAPRSVEEVEREGRLRLWPLAGSLAGLVLVMGGLVLAQTADQASQIVKPSPFSIEVAVLPDQVTPEPSPEPSISPSPSPTAAAPTTTPTPRATARPAKTATPKPATTPKPTPAPTPPPKPGPNVSASVRCFNKVAGINWSVTARGGTRLASVSISLSPGGRTTSPSVSGTHASGNREDQVKAGHYTYTVTARASDGGVTSRGFSITCS